ncbi:unnamed protein product [Paramecium pentaurelia]|uniref:Protein kinase domain-containing protein n=1 Tax=Paramecium pentaurelia TaxID=43138 RepID=A0A8S1V9D7_9CILI|nr:unnamed protein product [Paramecium pentaurelia]
MNQQFTINSVIHAPATGFSNRQFKIISEIGFGGQGTIYKAEVFQWKKEIPNYVAIKNQQKYNDYQQQIIQKIVNYQEKYEIQNSNKQPSQLVKIYDIFNHNSQQVLVMEVGQDNLDYFLKKQKLSFDKQLEIMIQLSQSILFFHQELKSIHRDIKPENFIQIGEEFKLIDFGTARFNTNNEKTIQIGTIQYQSPEIFQNQSNYTEAVDIWSLGCVFYEIFCQNQLFQGKNQTVVKQLIQNCIADQKDIIDKINSLNSDERIKNILKQMLQLNSQMRIKIDQVIKILKEIQNQKIPLIQKQNFNPNFNQNNNQTQSLQNLHIQKFQLNKEDCKFPQILNNPSPNNINQLNLLIGKFQDYSSQHQEQISFIQGQLTQIYNLQTSSQKEQESKQNNIFQEFKDLKIQIQTDLSIELENQLKKIHQDLIIKQTEKDHHTIEQKNEQIKELIKKVEDLNNQVSILKHSEKNLLNQIEQKDEQFKLYSIDQEKKAEQKFIQISENFIISLEQITQKQEQYFQDQQKQIYEILFQNLNCQEIKPSDKLVHNQNFQQIQTLNSLGFQPRQSNTSINNKLIMSNQNRQIPKEFENLILDKKKQTQKDENIVKSLRQKIQTLNNQINDTISGIKNQFSVDNYIVIPQNIKTLNDLIQQFIGELKNELVTSCNGFIEMIDGFKIQIMKLKVQYRGQQETLFDTFNELSEALAQTIQNLKEFQSQSEKIVFKLPKI